MLLAPGASGVRHVAGPERLSRFDFGRRFARLVGLPLERLQAAECDDPLRPRDLTLLSDVVCRRTLDEALRDS